jgi:hypothetical protein
MNRKIRKESAGQETNVWYELNERGKSVLDITAVVVKERLDWIRQGLEPNDAERPRKVYILESGVANRGRARILSQIDFWPLTYVTSIIKYKHYTLFLQLG